MSTAASTLGVKSIDHVTLVVADLERSRQFYVELLGMAEVPRPGFSFPGMWFQAGRTQIHLNIAGDEAGSAGVTTTAKQISRALHVAFEVDDAELAAQQLRDRGVSIAAGPRNRPDGYIQLYVHDHEASLVRPPKELKGFAKVALQPGQTETISFTLDFRAFAFYHPGYRQWVTEDGKFDIRPPPFAKGRSTSPVRRIRRYECLP